MSKTLVSKYLGSIVKCGTLSVAFADGDTTLFGSTADGFPDIVIRLTDSKVTRDIMLDPRLGAAEAFMDGRLLIESGDVMGLVQLLRANAPWDRGGSMGSPSMLRRMRGRIGAAAESLNNSLLSKRNVAHHYDIGNAFYQLMLDAEHMQYSCAYWSSEGLSLAEAQEAKLAHIAAKLALKPGKQVLDIGCGWGGMAIYLAKHADVRVHGITLSEEQLALAVQRAEAAGVSNRVTFE